MKGKSKRGQSVYMPVVIIDELEDIMREEEIQCKSTAFKQLAQHARIGREVQRMASFGYPWSRKKKDRKKVTEFSDTILPFQVGKK